ncbi:hypothetical protein U1Q18_004491 [Sarracenia purpurea var. burkii]
MVILQLTRLAGPGDFSIDKEDVTTLSSSSLGSSIDRNFDAGTSETLAFLGGKLGQKSLRDLPFNKTDSAISALCLRNFEVASDAFSDLYSASHLLSNDLIASSS